MINKVTIMILVHNAIENVKMSVESIRLFSDIETSLVIVDNHSTDGLNKWAKEQTDLTYVLFDEGHVSWGKAINMVRCVLQIGTDLLTMTGNYMLTSGSLSRMLKLAYKEENIGAVGGVYNGTGHNQSLNGNESYGNWIFWRENGEYIILMAVITNH
ncbi:MAG: glycosyltransferase family 2 protein [Lachnospiraceae bacterium]|nr:glycosyltransferase family 2 protein [Lachnospiraceae bacterium]